MFILQKDKDDLKCTISAIDQFLYDKCIDLIINGYINIGNKPNIIDSSLFTYLLRFFLIINNIEISKNQNDLVVKFNNYNLLVTNESFQETVQLGIQLDYLPTIHAKLDIDNIAIKILGISYDLSESVDYIENLMQLLEKICFLANQIPNLSEEMLNITSLSLQLASKIDSNIQVVHDSYILPSTHSIYKITKLKCQNIQHTYSFCIRSEEYEMEISIFTTMLDKNIYRIKFHDVNNNQCYMYIYNKSCE